MTAVRGSPVIDRIETRAFTVPTDHPESDGTLEWTSTTIVVVKVDAGDEVGLGYTYGDRAVATLIRDRLAPLIEGHDSFALRGDSRERPTGFGPGSASIRIRRLTKVRQLIASD